MELQLETSERARGKFNDAHMTAEQVEALCRNHFAPPHFAYLTQLRNGTGFARRKTRTADAVAMGTWPSRGIYLHGIEIKVSHGDFLAELKNPEKAEEIAQYCHYWWLAVSMEAVAPLAEVPENWGLLIASADRTEVKVVRQATRKSAVCPDHLLLAAILRNVAQDYIPKLELTDWKGKMRAELERAADANAATLRNSNAEKLREYVGLVGKIEAALGCRINEWNVGAFAKNYALAAKLNRDSNQVLAALRNLNRVVKGFDSELQEAERQLGATEPHDPTGR